jgi:hypothetical protein
MIMSMTLRRTHGGRLYPVSSNHESCIRLDARRKKSFLIKKEKEEAPRQPVLVGRMVHNSLSNFSVTEVVVQSSWVLKAPSRGLSRFTSHCITVSNGRAVEGTSLSESPPVGCHGEPAASAGLSQMWLWRRPPTKLHENLPTGPTITPFVLCLHFCVNIRRIDKSRVCGLSRQMS